MNYWPAESGNLAECVEPLIAMVNDLTVTGASNGSGDVWRTRLGGASQYRSLARVCADRWAELGYVAERGRMVVPASLGPLRIQR